MPKNTPLAAHDQHAHRDRQIDARALLLQRRSAVAFDGRSTINRTAFVDMLRDRLMAEGVNVWLDRHDMIAGTMQDRVWRAIQDVKGGVS